MIRIFLRVGLAIACLLVVSAFVPRAGAIPVSVDFTCGAPLPAHACYPNAKAGDISVIKPGSYSGTLDVFSSFSGGLGYTLTFNTVTTAITLTNNINPKAFYASGTIVSTTKATQGSDVALTFAVDWTTIKDPNIFNALFKPTGKILGSGLTTVEFDEAGSSPFFSLSADVNILSGGPTPEPSTLLLVGTGLLGLGLAFRRSTSTP